MQLLSFIFNSEIENGFKTSELTGISQLLKEFPSGTFRSRYLYEAEDINETKSTWKAPSCKEYGSFFISFRIRKARDILLENCSYSDLNVSLEVNGKRLPELPSRSNIEKILDDAGTIVIINERQYKVDTEVFGFQQVYDDSVRCIEELKKMGVPQETMAIYATPDEISLEVHPGIIGLAGTEDLHQKYHNLLCKIASIQIQDEKLIKTIIKTVLIDSASADFQILLPGSYHPQLHRPKVGVGPSHFAYGIAAFSDYCGKKRTDVECIQEFRNWLKFIQTDVPAMQTLKETVSNLPNVPFTQSKQGKKASSTSSIGGFQPFVNEIQASAEKLLSPLLAFPSRFKLIDKSLGGGWKKKATHIISGTRESGKATFLHNLAIGFAASAQVMFISFEHSMKEFLIRASSYNSRVSMSDLLAQTSQAGAAGDNARKTLAKMVNALLPKLGNNFFFRGVESSINDLNTENIRQLIGMMPPSENRMLFLESVTQDMISAEVLDELNEMCLDDEVTIFISVHSESEKNQKPNIIDNTDIEVLNKFQKHCESLSIIDTERAHLRKFVGMIKGQIDPQLVAKLEQKAVQMSGNKRLKSDAFSVFRLIHTRSGRREMTLMLYQPDLLSFFELISTQIGKI